MRFSLAAFAIIFLIPFYGFGQISEAELRLLQRLDSIAQSSSISRHFANLYRETTIDAITFFQHDDQEKKSFIQRLEQSFASYFFNAAEDYNKGEKTSQIWQAYYADPSLRPLQYELLGINAHINGDIWQALVNEFTFNEIRENRKTFLRFQKGLTVIYRNFHEKAKQENRRIKMLHTLSLGLDRLYGKLMLMHWRNRQLRLAEWHFNKPEKLKYALLRLNMKMGRINQLILRHL